MAESDVETYRAALGLPLDPAGGGGMAVFPAATATTGAGGTSPAGPAPGAAPAASGGLAGPNMALALQGAGAWLQGQGPEWERARALRAVETAKADRARRNAALAASKERQGALLQDARLAAEFIRTGRPQEAVRLLTERAGLVQQLGGDPSDTLGVLGRIQGGDIEGALQELDYVSTVLGSRLGVEAPEQWEPVTDETGRVIAQRNVRTGEEKATGRAAPPAVTGLPKKVADFRAAFDREPTQGEMRQLAGLKPPPAVGPPAGRKPADTDKLVKYHRDAIGRLDKVSRDIDAARAKVDIAARGTGPASRAQDDVALLFAYMKLIDPGSTVREGEAATAQQTTGIPGQIVQLYNQATRGEILTDAQREGFRRSAIGQYEATRSTYDQAIANQLSLVESDEIDPARVMGAPRLERYRERVREREERTGTQPGAAETAPVETGTPGSVREVERFNRPSGTWTLERVD